MLMLAVQFLCDTPAFLAARMGTFGRLPLLCAGRGRLIAGNTFLRVTVLVMFMNALGHKGIAVLGVFVIAGCSRRSLRVAAVRVMLRVVFAQATCAYCNAARLPILLGQHGLRAEGKEHCAAEQQAQYPFFQFHLVLPFFRTDCTVF